MFSGSASQSISPFESIGTLDSHFPILTGPRSSNGHAPVPSSFAQCMFDTGRDFLRQLGISEVLEFCRDSHCSVILSNNTVLISLCKLVHAERDAATSES